MTLSSSTVWGRTASADQHLEMVAVPAAMNNADAARLRTGHQRPVNFAAVVNDLTGSHRDFSYSPGKVSSQAQLCAATPRLAIALCRDSPLSRQVKPLTSGVNRGPGRKGDDSSTWTAGCAVSLM